MAKATIADFMTRRIEAISVSSSVQETAKKMRDKDVSSLVVIDDRDGIPLGLITERDIVRKVCVMENVTTSSVKNTRILSSPLITIKSNSSAEEGIYSSSIRMMQTNLLALLPLSWHGRTKYGYI